MPRLTRRRLALAVLGRLPIVSSQFHRVKRRRWLLHMLPVGSVGAEIGVWKGDFSAEIVRLVAPRTLHLIDPWQAAADDTMRGVLYDRPQADMDLIADGVRHRFAREVASGSVVIHRAPSATVAPELAEGSLDWVYIDGDHSYEGVRGDLEMFTPKVRDGGFVCGDDYVLGGRFGSAVKRAVDEFAQRAEIEIVATRGGQFVLRK